MLVAQLGTVCGPESSATVWSGPFVNDGGSFTGLTVRMNVSDMLCVPLVTVTVMVVVPNWFAAGVIDNVRVDMVFGPTTMLALGTNVVLLDVAVMVVKGVAASPTLKVNVGN